MKLLRAVRHAGRSDKRRLRLRRVASARNCLDRFVDLKGFIQQVPGESCRTCPISIYRELAARMPKGQATRQVFANFSSWDHGEPNNQPSSVTLRSSSGALRENASYTAPAVLALWCKLSAYRNGCWRGEEPRERVLRPRCESGREIAVSSLIRGEAPPRQAVTLLDPTDSPAFSSQVGRREASDRRCVVLRPDC